MQPVDNLNFWKERIRMAKNRNKLHHSVYISADGLWEKIYKTHLEVINKEIKPTDKVLDIGCGYGRMAPVFDNYTGVDFSPDFIAEARTLYPDKKFIVANLNKLPFKKNEFDIGIAISIKHMIIGNLGGEKWEPMAKEIKRVCKKVIILEYGTFESKEDTEETIKQYEIL